MSSSSKPHEAIPFAVRARPLLVAGAVLAALVIAYRLACAPGRTRSEPSIRSEPSTTTSQAAAHSELQQGPAGSVRETAGAPVTLPPEPSAPKPTDPFWGRVVEDSTGAPLGAAIVVPLDEQGNALAGSRTASTDANGLFRWDLEGSTQEGLCVRTIRHAPRFVTARPGFPRAGDACEIRLVRSARVDARVVGAPRSSELRLVVRTPRDSFGEGPSERSFRPDVVIEVPFTAEGSALAEGLVPRAPLALEVHGPAGLASKQAEPLVLEPEETRQIEFDLRAGTRLIVRMVDQHGREVADTVLWLTRRPETPFEGKSACYFQPGDAGASFARQRTDARGTATFEGVPPGAWWIGPERVEADMSEDPAAEPVASADAIAAVATFLELAEFEREHTLTLQVDRGLFLRGRLVDHDGVGVSAAFVGCEHEVVRGFVTGDVREDGTFELGPVASGVSLVRAIPHGRYLAPEPVRHEPDGREIVISLAVGARLSGLVVDASTGAPSRASVVCSRADETSPPHASIGEDGAFRFSGLAAGTYAVVACTEDGRSGWAEGLALEAGALRGDVRVELRAAGRLTLRSSGGPERVPFVIRIGPALVASGELERGIPTARFVPEGSLTVVLTGRDSQSVVRTVAARAGEPCEVVFELE